MRYIVLHDVGPNTKWYVSEIKYSDETYRECDWVLGTVLSQKIENALLFTNKDKAEKVAKILSDQYDEEGYHADYYVLERK